MSPSIAAKFIGAPTARKNIILPITLLNCLHLSKAFTNLSNVSKLEVYLVENTTQVVTSNFNVYLRQLHKRMGRVGRYFSCSIRGQQFLARFIPRNGDNVSVIGLQGNHITARITITKTKDEHHGPGKMPRKHSLLIDLQKRIA